MNEAHDVSAAEDNAFWQRLNELRDKHEALHRDHVELRTDVMGRVNAIDSKVDSHATRSEQRHAEVMTAIKQFASAEDQRTGMSRAAAVIGSTAAFILTCATIYALVIK
jgi:hypothetical protein